MPEIISFVRKEDNHLAHFTGACEKARLLRRHGFWMMEGCIRQEDTDSKRLHDWLGWVYRVSC